MTSKYDAAAKARKNKRKTQQVKDLYTSYDAGSNSSNNRRGGTAKQKAVPLANTIVPDGAKPQVTKQQNFAQAFKKARKELGPGKTFKYKLQGSNSFKTYTTDYKKEPKK